jgi:microcystin-dependent protein
MNPFIGQIRIFAGNYAPSGWFFCDGSLLSIAEYDILYNLLGTTYGGDGVSTFALPDLRGRTPIHQGFGPDAQNYVIGEVLGSETVTLTPNQLPAHTHAFTASSAVANTPNPGNNYLAQSTQVSAFFGDNPSVAMQNNSLTPVGGSQPHENRMPFLTTSFIIAYEGIFPQHP